MKNINLSMPYIEKTILTPLHTNNVRFNPESKALQSLQYKSTYRHHIGKIKFNTLLFKSESKHTRVFPYNQKLDDCTKLESSPLAIPYVSYIHYKYKSISSRTISSSHSIYLSSKNGSVLGRYDTAHPILHNTTSSPIVQTLLKETSAPERIETALLSSAKKYLSSKNGSVLGRYDTAHPILHNTTSSPIVQTLLKETSAPERIETALLSSAKKYLSYQKRGLTRIENSKITIIKSSQCQYHYHLAKTLNFVTYKDQYCNYKGIPKQIAQYQCKINEQYARNNSDKTDLRNNQEKILHDTKNRYFTYKRCNTNLTKRTCTTQKFIHISPKKEVSSCVKQNNHNIRSIMPAENKFTSPIYQFHIYPEKKTRNFHQIKINTKSPSIHSTQIEKRADLYDTNTYSKQNQKSWKDNSPIIMQYFAAANKTIFQKEHVIIPNQTHKIHTLDILQTSKQIANNINTSIPQLQINNYHDLSIQLKPDFLGYIHINMKIKNHNTLHAIITTQHQHTLDFLQKNTATLVHIFQNVGFQEDHTHIQFTLEKNNQQQMSHHHQEQQKSQQDNQHQEKSKNIFSQYHEIFSDEDEIPIMQTKLRTYSKVNAYIRNKK